MDGEIDWQVVEHTCAENRELGEIVRWLERLYGGDPSVDWTEARRRRVDALFGFLEDSPKSHALIARFQGAEFEVGGDEHLIVRVEDDPERVFKITHGDAFGCHSFFSPHDPDLTGKHFHGSLNEDPIFYLQRWMLLNSFGGYRTRFEGLLPPEPKLRLPRICVSQPTLDGPNPGREEIRERLAVFGFEKISEDAFIHFENRILLTDAAPRNFPTDRETLALFDAIALMAPAKVYEWAMGRRRLS